MIYASEINCPKCGMPKMKTWAELTDEQKILVRSLPGSAEFTRKERKKHRFCTRCWFENSSAKSPVKA